MLVDWQCDMVDFAITSIANLHSPSALADILVTSVKKESGWGLGKPPPQI